MAKEESITVNGVIEEVLPNASFKVVLENGQNVLAHLAGKMRLHNIRLMVGDRVQCEISPYDLSKARITYRYR